jgi:hypothetical protein
MAEVKYEVVESKVLKHKVTGKIISIYSAVTSADDWEVVTTGWTVHNPYTNQTGVGRPPWATQAEAQAYADKYRPSRIGYGD